MLFVYRRGRHRRGQGYAEPRNVLDTVLALEDDALELEIPSPITLEELICAQAEDPLCSSIRSQLERGGRGIAFADKWNTGLLERSVPDHSVTVVPVSLRPRLLRLAH